VGHWVRKLVIALLALFCFVGMVGWVASAFMPVGGSRKVQIVIPARSSSWDIAKALKKAGIIRSVWGFVIAARVLGESTKLQAGEYEFSPEMNLIEVIDKIASGDTLSLRVTIPEGYTIEQIAALLKSHRLAEEPKFIQLARYHAGRFRDLLEVPGNSLEGYLFPDTYLIPKATSEEAIIRMMLTAFQKKILEPMDQDLQSSDRTLHEIVTMASMVEREARKPQERSMIAAVLWNRLQEGMRLQCDATVQYALGYHKSRLLYEDLKVESPYNTYLHPGLPPGPIANPGKGAIQAALKPARLDAFYYVARPDGSHIFSKTLDEHQRAIQEVQRLRKREG